MIKVGPSFQWLVRRNCHQEEVNELARRISRASAPAITAAASIETEMPGLNGDLSLAQLAILVAYAILMLGVCLLACVVPTRRALSVEPTIALRVE